MNKDLLDKAQEEYLRQYNICLISDKKKPIILDIDLDELIEKYLKEKGV